MSAQATTDASNCSYVLGDDGLARWSDLHSRAWIGLLETHKRLTRSLDAELEAEHGLSLSALEVLRRLAAAEGHHLQLSALASASGLSLSRISRIIDSLETRGLVERRRVVGDGRAVDGQLTRSGLHRVRSAQCSHFAAVQRRFFARLSDSEIEALAEIFSRFVPADVAEECSAQEPATRA